MLIDPNPGEAVNEMVVAYFPALTARTEVALRPIVGRRIEESPYPIVVGTFDSGDELETTLRQLQNLRLDEYLVVRSEDSPATDLDRDAAIERVKTSEHWEAFLEDFQSTEAEVSLSIREHPFCWIVLAEVKGAGIPPGIGYLVDKQTGRVFPRRFIDIMQQSTDEEAESDNAEVAFEEFSVRLDAIAAALTGQDFRVSVRSTIQGQARDLWRPWRKP
jgi:hypothetical protein